MDLIIKLVEPYSFDLLFPETWKNTDITRQFIEVFIVLAIGGELFYFFTSGLDYFFFFDKRWLEHKKILPNQVERKGGKKTKKKKKSGLICFVDSS